MAQQTKKSKMESTTGITELPSTLPLIPLRNTVIFPVLTIPLSVGRPRSVAALEAGLKADKLVAVLTQRNADENEPGHDGLHTIGTVCRIMKSVKLADGNHSIVVQGLARIKVNKFLQEDPYSLVQAELVPTIPGKPVEVDALMMNLKQLASSAIDLNPNIPDEAHAFVDNIDDPGILADLIASNLRVETDEKQKVLETFDLMDRMHKIIELLSREVQVLELSQKIKSDVKGEIDKSQREYFLREQLKAIRKELGEEEGAEEEVESLRKRIEEKNLPEHAKQVALKELNRLERTAPQNPEHGTIRTYLDWILDLPWTETTADRFDLAEVRRVLDAHHYGLDKVKRRIVEFLAILKLRKEIKGQILCLVGPPGVGKTSLGQSIAKATGREFVRASLGGVRDEAEIRGHRRTYIGALPGRIVQKLKKVGTVNPVFVLDEVDKIGADFRGDPSSALLEVLDPEQNNSFNDHYLELDYDLSKVMFIATANRVDTIPPALLDRMEVIELSGYTHLEKMRIARDHLIPKQLGEHGLTTEQVEITDGALLKVIDEYTRESGVRNLTREIASLFRGCASRIVEDSNVTKIVIDEAAVTEILGPQKIFKDLAEVSKLPGVAIGLAWTPTGGDILYIESSGMPGKGKLQLTGQLGDVMKESAQLALSYLRSRGARFGIDQKRFEETDVHIHVPAGGIPKDGPSAGIALMTSLASLLIDKPIKPYLAMTGEVTLRGHVLPVGGVKEKVIAASRAGAKEVILPSRNEKDLRDVPEEIRKTLRFHFADTMEQVLRIALGLRPKTAKSRFAPPSAPPTAGPIQ